MIEGWIFSPTVPDHKFSLSIYAGEQLIEHVLSDLYREDLHNAGYGDGYVAFCYVPPAVIPVELLTDIRIRLAYSNVYLLPDEVTRIETGPQDWAGYEEAPESLEG